MLLLLCHLTGDYVLQSHVMATRKTSSWRWAVVHAAFYSVPFAVLFMSLGVPDHIGGPDLALAVIFSTHAIIDRYAIAARWCRLYGVGTEGSVVGAHMRMNGYVLGEVVVKPDLVETRWVPSAVVRAFDAVVAEDGFDRANAWLLGHSVPRIEDAPPFLGVWLTIIVDNTMHLAINAAAVYLATGGLP